MQAKPVDTYSVQLFQGNFIVRRGTEKDTVPVKLPPPDPMLASPYRRDQTFVVWDDRGLTVRVKDKTFVTKFEEIATTPKLFAREEIIANVAKFQAGTRRKEADAMAGSVRVGNFVYFLPRWNDKDGTPWLEALVRVDLTHPNPKPQLLGKFPGFSLATQPIDRQLTIFQGKLMSIVRQGGLWGQAIYDVDAQTFDFNPAGASLATYQALTPRFGIYTEKTSYGTQVAAKVDWVNLHQRILLETRGSVRVADPKGDPILILTEGGKVYAVNADTGARQVLPSSSAVRRSKYGVVVWSPFDNPRRAWLYHPDRWQVLATLPPTVVSER